MKAVVDEAGRIHLPEDLRRELGVKAGDEVVLEARAGEWVLRSAHAQSGLAWEGTVLVHKGTSTTVARIENLIDEARAERSHQLTQGFTQ